MKCLELSLLVLEFLKNLYLEVFSGLELAYP